MTARKRHRQRGFQLVELLVVLALAGLISTLTVPPLLRLSAGLRVGLAASELAGALRLARSHALRLGTNVGLKLYTEPGKRVYFALYRDGDGDGVRTADIRSGADPALTPLRELAHLGGHVRFGFPEGPAPRDPGDPRRRLDRLDDPVRFNRSDMASFSPLGTSTPGSLYLTDGRGQLAVVRLFGRTGKIKILRYDMETERWR